MAVTLSYTTLGSEFLVNTQTVSSQVQSDIVGLSNGGYVITWQDFGNAGSGYNIKAQVFDALGGKVGGEIPVNTSLQDDQTVPAVTQLANGNFVITWQDDSKQLGDASGTSIKAQIFTPAGAKVGTEFLVNTQTANAQVDPDIVAMPGGGFVVTWSDFSLLGGDASSTSIKAQMFDAAGAKVGGEFLVNTTTNSAQSQPHIAKLANGTFAITWYDGNPTVGDTDSTHIAAQIFNANGGKIGGEVLVNLVSQDAQTVSAPIGFDAGGYFLTAWSSQTGAGSIDGSDIKLRVLNPNGSAFGQELTVNTQTALGQVNPAGASLGNGYFVYTWADANPIGDGDSWSIKFQLFDANGPVGLETLANTQKVSTQYQADVGALTSGGFVVSWSDTAQTVSDVKAQMYQPVLTGDASDDSVTAPKGASVVNLAAGTDTITFDFALTNATVRYDGNRTIIDTATSHTVITGAERFVFTDGTVENNDGNALVDDLFYYSHNLDVWNAKFEADLHYSMHGWKEGRDPSAFFDTSFYLSVYQDVRAAGVNPLVEFDTSGWKAGRLPSPAFDAAAYLAANPDVAAAKVDPLAHYLQFGYEEGRLPIAGELIAANGFDYGYYLNQNADVAAAGIDPFQHFQDFGWKEGRKPNALFDTGGYLSTYTDVKAAGVNPLDHYHQNGWKEGRDPSVNFDSTSYLDAYADVKAAGIDPLAHFLDNGIHEGRARFGDGVWG